MLTLGEKQELFKELKTKLEVWIYAQGWKLRQGEGRILPLGPDGKGRKARDVATGKIIKVRDLVHKENGNHYNGLAEDLMLFIDTDGDGDTEWIVDGNHKAWKRIGPKWESLHPLCRWGGRWGDANHISLEHNGIK